MVVAHATVLRLTASLTALDSAGGTERRPIRSSGNSQRWLKLAEAFGCRSAFASTAIRENSDARKGEHLARRACSPRCSPSCSPVISTAEIAAAAGAPIQAAKRTRYQTAIKAAFRSVIHSLSRTVSSVDLRAQNDDDKRGVSNPRAGCRTESRQKQGGCSRPGSTAGGDEKRQSRGTDRRAD